MALRVIGIGFVLAVLTLASSTAAAQNARSDTTVKMVGAPRFPGVARLVEELSIGAEDKGPDYQLSFVRALMPARDGSIWVLNEIGIRPNGATIRRYDALGKFLKTVAIAGQGPGEISMASAMAQMQDGRVLVRDNPASPNKVLVFSEQATYLTSWTWPSVEGQGRTNISTIMVDTGGTVYTGVMRRPASAASVARPQSEMWLARFDSGGRFLGLLPPPDRVAMLAAAGADQGEAGPFAIGTRTAWSPLGYFVTAVNSRYSIEQRVPRTSNAGNTSAPRVTPLWNEGDPVISIRRPAEAIVFSAAERRDRDAFEQARVAGGRSGSASPPVPRTKPAFRALMVGGEGRIWVQLSVPSEQCSRAPRATSRGTMEPQLGWCEPTVYDVYEPDSAYIGRVAVPSGASLYHVKGNTAWGVVNDADGVPTIKRYRIAWQ